MELLSKIFSTSGQRREATGLIGGILFLLLLNILYAPDLGKFPNFLQVGYVGKFIVTFVIAYAIGELMLVVGWAWTVLGRLQPLKINSRSVKGWWIKFFRSNLDSTERTIDHDRLERLILGHARTEFTEQHLGLKSKYSRIINARYTTTMLIALSLTLIVVTLLDNTSLLDFTWLKFWAFFGVLVSLTVYHQDILNELSNFDSEVGDFLAQTERKVKKVGGN